MFKSNSENNKNSGKKTRPGVKALIVHEGKILMIHEHVMRDDVSIEITDFPGGGVDFGETLREALVREVKEEIGLDVKVGEVVGAWDFVLGPRDHGDLGKQGTHIICIGYSCEVIGKIKIDMENNPAQEEIFKAEWYSKDEVFGRGMLRHKGMIEAVEKLKMDGSFNKIVDCKLKVL